ncbi:MAG: hypothetical protein WKI04_19910 [Ferruginibacter sp.]
MSKSTNSAQPGEDNTNEIDETLKEGKKDPSVQEALKKERQPGRSEDLSPLHNTREIGTSGGDQRVKESDKDQ